MDCLMILKCLAIGSAMGLLSGLVGVGGGIVAVPCFIYFLGMSPSVAMGTSLAVIIPVAIGGTFKHFQQGNVVMKYAVIVAVGGILCAYLGAMINHYLGTSGREVWLKRIFSIIMIVIGTRMLYQSTLPAQKKVSLPLPPQTIPVTSEADKE